jgi:hypothetical protein
VHAAHQVRRKRHRHQGRKVKKVVLAKKNTFRRPML